MEFPHTKFFCIAAYSRAVLSLVAITLFCPAASTNLVAEEKSGTSFASTVQPFLKQHCLNCHSGDDAEADLPLGKIKAEFKSEDQSAKWQLILQALQFDDMPPPDETRPDPLQKAAVVSWIETQLTQSGHGDTYRQKLMQPEFGNYLSHELLFSGTIKDLPFSPSRLWRFSPQIFRRKGIREAKSPFSFVTSESGVRDYSAISGVDQSTVEMILINTSQLLDLRTQEGDFRKFGDDQPEPSEQEWRDLIRREFRRAIGRPADAGEQQKYFAFLQKNITAGGRLDGLKTTIKAMYLCSESIYRMELGLGPKDEHGRRMLSPQELSYAVAYALTDSLPEQNRVLRDAIRERKLSTREDVAAVVQTILDEGMTPEKTPRIIRFFEEFFGYNKADKVFKDDSRVNEANLYQWNPHRLMYEAEQFVQHFINRDQDVIKELLTSNRYLVAHPGDNQIAKKYYDEVMMPEYADWKVNQKLEEWKRVNRDPERDQEKRELARIKWQAEERRKIVVKALEDGLTPFPGWPYERVNGVPVRGQGDLIYIAVYNLPPTAREQRQEWDWPLEQPFALPDTERAGMLTHPAWLAAHSLNDGNDPIRRGRWITEKLLAGVIPDVPPDVDANVPNDPHKTLRERMEPLRAERCWRCHRKMNPLGEPFEIFDDWGRHRTQVFFDSDGRIVNKRGQEFEKWLQEGKVISRDVDASGEVRGSGNPAVDGPVTDAIQMMHRIGNSARARQSFIRHLFRYFMGRNEMLSDSATLVAAENAYLDNGGSFKALVVSLLTSDSFLYRR